MKSFSYYTALFVLIIIGLLTSMSGSASELSDAETINKAGRQRMLTQRITKNYCLIGLQAKPEQARTELDNSIRLFESQLAELQQFSDQSGNEKLQQALLDVASGWSVFRDLALTLPDKENAMRLMEMDEKLLMASDNVVKIIQDLSGQEPSKLVNISGRQRMLSQRLSKLYVMLSWGLSTPSIHAKIEESINEFKGGLDTLSDAPENNMTTNETITEAWIQWLWLYSSINFQEEAYFPLIVQDASEKMLQRLEQLTLLYEQLAKS